MDGNKDASLKCLRIGKEALDAGDEARATRFLTKAKRLDPSLPVDDLLSSIGSCGGGGDECKERHSPEPQEKQEKKSNGPNLTRRASSSAKEKDVPESSDSSRAYTEEQVTIVRKIKKEKDYYQILGLERNCTVEDVRKAYRKLSLKVHPDKNKAPGAEESFKAVSKAFQCLSNAETKKRYDVVGSDEPEQVSRRSARHDGYGYNGFYEAEIDPDEIFRNFFFGGMAPTTTNFGQFRFRTGGTGGVRTHHEMHGSSGSNLRMLLQVLPIIVLILVNFIPSIEQPYALSRSYDYDHRLETPRDVPFFVKQGKFEQNYPHNSVERLRLEERIEREYVSIVSQNCRVEIQRRQWGYGNQTPHCDMLQKYEAAVASEA